MIMIIIKQIKTTYEVPMEHRQTKMIALLFPHWRENVLLCWDLGIMQYNEMYYFSNEIRCNTGFRWVSQYDNCYEHITPTILSLQNRNSVKEWQKGMRPYLCEHACVDASESFRFSQLGAVLLQQLETELAEDLQERHI